jgi:hypothetical protein
MDLHKKIYKHNHVRQGYLYKLWEVGLTEWPDGKARRRMDGRLTEGARVPDGEWEWHDGGRDGCQRRAGSRGVAQRWVSRVAQRATI